MDLEDAPIKPVTSAYQYFTSDQYSNHKDDFEGMPMGARASEMSQRWNSLGHKERARFVGMSERDKARHLRECTVRDELVAAQQAQKREARFELPASGEYMRERAPEKVKKQRTMKTEEEMTEEQLLAKRKREQQRLEAKEARLEREAESLRQKENIAKETSALAKKK
ncbi:unnamed protein product [Choristocarpus tenellus]